MKKATWLRVFSFSLSILLLNSLVAAQGTGPRGPRKAAPGSRARPARRRGDIRLRSFGNPSPTTRSSRARPTRHGRHRKPQTLTDGSKLTRRKTDTLYRDSEGRTRREQQFDRVSRSSTGSPPDRLINDPVSGQITVLDVNRKTARNRVPTAGQGPPPQNALAPAMALANFGPGSSDRPQDQSLGKQIIRRHRGCRHAHDLHHPRRKNRQRNASKPSPERWESTDLQIVVLSKHIDPFAGETSVSPDEPETRGTRAPSSKFPPITPSVNIDRASPRTRPWDNQPPATARINNSVLAPSRPCNSTVIHRDHAVSFFAFFSRSFLIAGRGTLLPDAVYSH